MKIFVIFTLLIFYISNYIPQNDNIVIVGKTESPKDGATVVTKDKKRYYVDGIDYWGKNYDGKNQSYWNTSIAEISR